LPCDPDAEDSVCCGSGLGSACLSNRLCQGGNGNLIRGTCTDKSWDSPECSKTCIGPILGPDLISCSNVTGSSTSYCCDHSEDCCDTGTGRFSVLPENPREWAVYNRASRRFVVVGTTYDGNESTSSQRTSSTATTIRSETQSIQPESSSAIVQTTGTTSQPTTSTSTEPDPDSATSTAPPSKPRPGLSTAGIAGIAVGVGIAFIALLVAAYLVGRRHRRKKRDAATHDIQRFVTSGHEYKPPREPQEVDGTGLRAELPAEARRGR
jgi:hypothetical protein